ncbi:MAG: HAD family hydrolase [Moritella sp.]|uniref:HAD family hydrolase n=1 Tax=Moritella sp. TaxID=78556 RepID=UPI000C0E70D0|nr:HAD hydrolase-like protein [Moritella sp.]MBL1417584.1 HAD family hydrolase [Moritella sp.]
MYHVMFDIDGTLVESYDFDARCLSEAVKEATNIDIDTNWARYKHVTDAGILNEFFEENNIRDTGTIAADIKQIFLTKIKTRIAKKPLNEISGASTFIAKLKALDNVVISFATGGWHESAVLKLESAGIDFSEIPIASSNDHHARIEIMKIAEKMAVANNNLSFTYFGDGSWDLKACEELGVNFVLVGDKLEYNQSIKDFSTVGEAFAYIGLS